MTTKDYKALSRLIMYDKIKRFYEEDHQLYIATEN